MPASGRTLGQRGRPDGGTAYRYEGAIKDGDWDYEGGEAATDVYDGGGSGRQWFSVAGVTQANRSERVRHARAVFDRVVSGEIEKHGFAGRFDCVAFFGFSQGAIIALDAVASGRWPVRAVVVASGRLATAPEAKGPRQQ
jgi:predicted esterase